MTYITIKTKKTNANVEIFPPIVLGEKSHISLLDIRIPEEVTKRFAFTNRQVISTEPNDRVTRMKVFPEEDDYNIPKLQHMIKNSPLSENLSLINDPNNNNVYIKTKSNIIRFSRKLAESLNIPEIIMPFSSMKISGDEKYLINCNLVENRSSYSFGAPVHPSNSLKVYTSNLLAIAPSRDGRYPELTIQSVNKIINNLTLEILTENLETPEFANKEIIYILKVW